MQQARAITTSPLVVVIAGVLLASGCGAENLAEEAIERQIESESGEDIELDINDGEIIIDTDEGRIEVRTDEDGNVSVQGETDEGSFSANADTDEDGNVVIQGESADGEGSFEMSGDGESATFESEDGSMVISGDGSLPDEFPSSVPLPGGLTIESTTVLIDDQSQNVSVSGIVTDDQETVADAYVSALEDAGFTQQVVQQSPSSTFFIYQNAEYTVSGTVTADGNSDGDTLFALNVGPTEN